MPTPTTLDDLTDDEWAALVNHYDDSVPDTPAPDARIDNRARNHITEREDTRAWTQRGTCHTMMSELGDDLEARRKYGRLFFPTRHTGISTVDRARAICRSCAVRPECLAYSLANWEKVGIWGGETETERRITRRSMRAAGIGDGTTAGQVLPWVLDRLYPTTPEPDADL